MPASITMDLVVSRPKVAGRRMLMPERGPMPGNTPTIVPTRHPRKAYHKTSGCSATEKPSSRLSMLESEQALLDRGLQRDAKQQIGKRDDAQAEGRGRDRMSPLDSKDEDKQKQHHGEEKADDLIERHRKRCDRGDAQCMRQVLP